jgi:hypothetical protein
VSSRPMRGLFPLLALWGILGPGLPAAAQEVEPATRLVGFTIDPQEPEFAEVIDLQVTIRVPPGSIVFVPDTLVPGDASVSAGSGEWATVPGPADSVDVRANYPIMGFLNGTVELPEVELWARPVMAGEEGGAMAAGELVSATAVEMASLRRQQIFLGEIQITPLRAMGEAGNVLNPRPPADVLGGDWSAWLISAIMLSLAVGATIIWLILSRLRAGSGAHGIAQEVGSPRLKALRELDEIYARDLLAEGRCREFYDATTGVLRRFSERYEADWGIALTSTELLGRLRDRWGPQLVESLDDPVSIAEWVKFGTYRPGIDMAEGHWRRVRDWIERVPGS